MNARDALEVVRLLAGGCGDLDHAHTSGMVPEALAVLTALFERAGEPVAWMPIETAPKDGTRCIVTNGAIVGDAWFSKDREEWWWTNTHPTDFHGDGIWDLTHWQPLPAAPGASHEQ